MNAQSKKRLEEYKKGDISPQNTEGVENTLIREASRLADRKKWQNMLAEDGVQRTETPVVELKKSSTGIIRRLAPYAIGLAAAVAFLVMFILRTENFDSQISNNHYPAAEVRMGPNADDIAAWKKAMAAYKNNHFSETTQLINSITSPTNEQKFYLALSSIYQEKPDYNTAATLFKDFVVQNDAVYVEEARWFLAYSLFKAGKKEEAKTVLNEIVNSKGYNHEKAATILKKEF
jgi:tetratricopeptide (TPR) repeat protein